LSDVIVPFLLSALDPEAVNQSHQAPSALFALSMCFRSFLYPNPVIIPYLADILKLSLNGIDPNDPKKTSSTISLYNSIFVWIPIGKQFQELKTSDSTDSYLSLACGVTSSKNSIDMTYHLEALAEYTAEWALAFVDKMITLFEANEEKQKGKKNAFAVGPMVCDTFENVFLSSSTEVRDQLVDKVLLYLKLQCPKNTDKEWAKILDTFTWTNPGIAFVSPDILA
jgi:hypothetical protein